MSRRSRRQRSFRFARGRGRPRKKNKRAVPHRERPQFVRRRVLHVSIRMRRDVPRLRRRKLAAVIRRALIRGCKKEGFRICEFSIQSNHIHLVCEADHHVALSRGMQGFNIRVAKGINKELGRSGAVLEQRYSAQHASSATQVRNTLCYVLHNARRHGARFQGADMFSSARYFTGWSRPTGLPPPGPPGPDAPWPVAPARTPLLSQRWRFIGLIDPDETPPAGRALGLGCPPSTVAKAPSPRGAAG